MSARRSWLNWAGPARTGAPPVRDLPRTVLPEALRLDWPGARAVAGSGEEGWSLIELAEVRPAEPPPLDAVGAEVEASLRQKEAAAAFRALLDDLRANAEVRMVQEALARLSQSGQGEGWSGRLSDRPSDHGDGRLAR